MCIRDRHSSQFFFEKNLFALQPKKMSRLKTSFKILSVTSCIWLSYSHTNKRRPNNNRVAPFLAHCSSSEESLQMLFHKARTGDQNFLNNNRNIDVRDTDATGRTVLHMAAMSNNLACVRTLVEKHGADINATDNNNLSVLEYAAQKGNIAIVNYLLEKGFFGFFPDLNNNVGGAVAVIENSNQPRKSIIDQAAKLSSKLPIKKWTIKFIDKQTEEEIYDFLLGWGLSFYKFNITAVSYTHLTLPTKRIV